MTCCGLYREAMMSTLPRPETLVLMPCTALPPSPSFAAEPVALPGCELRKGGQDRTGEVSPVISNMSRSLLQASTLALGKSTGCAKNHDLPQRHSTDVAAIVLFTRVGGVCAPWALPSLAEGRRGSGVGRREPSAGLFPWSWPEAVGRSAWGYRGICLRRGRIQVPK